MGEGYTGCMKRPFIEVAPLVALAAMLVAGCPGDEDTARQSHYSIPAGVSSKAADVSLLFMGNSHASLNRLQAMVAQLVHARRADDSIAAVEAPGWMFLEDRYRH